MSVIHSKSQVGTLPSVSNDAAGQHSILKSLGMHILPGVFIFVMFVAITPRMMEAGLPALVPILISALLGLAFQLWHLLNEGHKLTGKWSLNGIVLFRQSMPVWQYFLLIPVFVVLAFLINGPASSLGTTLLKLTPWVPAWFEVRDQSILLQYPRWILMVTFLALYFPINGIAAPIIEEFYFRGYLMPRLSRFGKWTPLLETVFFTLYHFWQPYYWLTQFLSMLPVVYAVWWKRNIKLGIFIHISLNMLGGLLTFASLMGQP